MTTEVIVGTGASLLTAIASAPQLIKLIKEKNSENVSVLMYCVLITGLSFWVYYGILKSDRILIVSNSFSFLINTSVLILALVYKR